MYYLWNINFNSESKCLQDNTPLFTNITLYMAEHRTYMIIATFLHDQKLMYVCAYM